MRIYRNVYTWNHDRQTRSQPSAYVTTYASFPMKSFPLRMIETVGFFPELISDPIT